MQGDFSKNVYLMTNDPENPFLKLPVRVKSKPRYYLDSSVGGAMTADNAGVARFEARLTFAKGAKKFVVSQAALTGLPGKASFAAIKSESGEVEGYRFYVKVDPVPPNGRFAAQLNILTDDPNLKFLERTIIVQRGITCVPSELFVGDLGKERRTFRAEILKPKMPFKILNAVTTVPGLSMRFEEMPTLGYRMIVTYAGSPSAGLISGRILLQTDDKQQPEIEIPVSGNFVK